MSTFGRYTEQQRRVSRRPITGNAAGGSPGQSESGTDQYCTKCQWEAGNQIRVLTTGCTQTGDGRSDDTSHVGSRLRER